MRWISLAIAAFAVISWAQTFAPMYSWIRDIPVWVGHLVYGIMFFAAILGIVGNYLLRRFKKNDG